MRSFPALILGSVLALAGGVGAQPRPPTATPSADHAIRGRVVDAQGRPIAGARVVLAHELDATMLYGGHSELLSAVERRAREIPGGEAPPGATVGRTNSGEDGEFEFSGLADGRFTLAAVHADCGMALVPEVESSQGEALQLTLGNPTYFTVRLDHFALDPRLGYVDLEGESPVPNLQLSLRLRSTDAEPAGGLTTGPIPAIPGAWTLVAYVRNEDRCYTVPWLSAPVEIEPGAHNRLVIDASLGHTLSGRVIDASGDPLCDVAVLVRPPGAPRAVRGTFTAADGSYRIAGLEPGPYDVEAVRHRLRAEVGCGDGPRDVEVIRRIRVPPESPEQTELRIERLVDQLAVGDAAPEFAGPGLDGAMVRLSDFRGKVVLLDFWATWCALCIADLQHIARLHEELSDRGFAVVSVSLDPDARAVERFLRRQRIPWPQLVLGPASRNPVARLYNVASTPTTMLIDRQGRIAARNVAGEDLRAEVLRLLD